jgi:inositol-pentakisphosphate 2-kinase
VFQTNPYYVQAKTSQKASLVGIVNGLADPKEALLAALLPVLMGTPVLRTLSHLQRTLDPLDIEGFTTLWETAQRPPLGPEPDIAEYSTFLDAYLSAPAPPVNPANLRFYALAFLLSTTFKDCSVMVRVPDGTATVIDLDPKRLHHMQRWQELDSQIVSAYSTLPERERKVCIDAWREHDRVNL